MIFYFADRKMNILGNASTENRHGSSIFNDKETEYEESPSSTQEFILPVENLEEAKNMTTAGNYILFNNEFNQTRFYTIITSELDRLNSEIYVVAENAGIDLLNEEVTAWASPGEAKPIIYYVEKAIADTGFEIRVNEVSNLTRTLSWDGESTSLERLLSIGTQFDNTRFEFNFEFDGLTITNKYVDILKQRGTDTGLQLRLNTDINNIITTSSIEELATALRPTGGTPEGSDIPINLLTGISYDDGDIYLESGLLKSRTSLAKWSRYLAPSEQGTNEGHIVRNFSFDTLSKTELLNRSISRLKQIKDVAVNYEVDIAILPETVQIGDIIDIIDEEGELFLGAKVLKIERSRADKKATATLGDFLLKDGGIDLALQQVADNVTVINNTVNNMEQFTFSPYEPENPRIGQVWYQTNTPTAQNPNPDTVESLKQWDGTAWVPAKFDQDTLIIRHLIAIIIDNPFTATINGAQLSGNVNIQDGQVRIEYTVSATGQHGYTAILPVGLFGELFDVNDVRQNYFELTAEGLTLQDFNGNGGTIRAENLRTVDWTNLTLNSGFVVSQNNIPQYRRFKNLDGSYTVELRGQVERTSGTFGTASSIVATMPVGHRPPLSNQMYMCPDDTFKGARVTMQPAGGVQINSANNSVYVNLSPITFKV